ncbi:MAG: hypothetical protein ACMUJM_24485 [bacterium]
MIYSVIYNKIQRYNLLIILVLLIIFLLFHTTQVEAWIDFPSNSNPFVNHINLFQPDSFDKDWRGFLQPFDNYYGNITLYQQVLPITAKSNQWVNLDNSVQFGQLQQQSELSISWEDAIDIIRNDEINIPTANATSDNIDSIINYNYIEFTTIYSSVLGGFSDRTTKRLEVINNQTDYEEAYFGTNENAKCSVHLDTYVSIDRCQSYSLDLDNDGEADFIFSYSYPGTGNTPQTNKAIKLDVYTLHEHSFLPDEAGLPVFSEMDIIDDSIQWSNYSGYLAIIGWSITDGWEEKWRGTWAGVEKKYLPLKIVKNNLDYYGWAQLTVSNVTGEMILHDFAIETTPFLGILAGNKHKEGNYLLLILKNIWLLQSLWVNSAVVDTVLV